jgi:hypothetical protein
MYGAIMMAIAIGGLGSHNKSLDVTEAPSTYAPIGSAYANPYAIYTTPSSYSGYDSMGYRSYKLEEYTSHRGAVRSTLWSLVLGHDPDVPTAREIEETVYGTNSGHGHH